ncbi:hypothetical protein K0A97_02025 [Patescibacteria group bacterium]|nr:hypothetical protein [Patescibacteria group bacterium]
MSLAEKLEGKNSTIEVKVDGALFYTLKIREEGISSEVYGDRCIPTGTYALRIDGLRIMVENRMKRDYPGREININIKYDNGK